VALEEPGQTNTPRSSPLNPNLFHFAKTDQPTQQLLITCPVGGKRFHTQQPTVAIDRCRHMDISMSVDTTSNTYDSHGRPFR